MAEDSPIWRRASKVKGKVDAHLKSTYPWLKQCKKEYKTVAAILMDWKYYGRGASMSWTIKKYTGYRVFVTQGIPMEWAEEHFPFNNREELRTALLEVPVWWQGYSWGVWFLRDVVGALVRIKRIRPICPNCGKRWSFGQEVIHPESACWRGECWHVRGRSWMPRREH